MFSGIVECVGKVADRKLRNGNLDLQISAPFSKELKIDQSIAHNGACLTVVSCSESNYTVTAIAETLQKTNLGDLQPGDPVNLERCVKVGDRLDGHIVQGHVDGTGEISKIETPEGSKVLHVRYSIPGMLTVPKGSICVNGVSLTVVNSGSGSFSVHIIPFTAEHTNLGNLKVGDKVNLEFDILGKYVDALLKKQH